MNAFTIRDLENLTGVRAHTIRIWEQRYGFLRPQRTDTNIRYYNNEELKKILNVSLLNKYGYKISRINQMSDREIHEKLLTLSQAEAVQEKIINDLIQYMVDIDMDSFEKVIDQQIRIRGIEKTILDIIFPYMERIGVLWLTSHIHPVQEHLVTNIIRQKLLVGTEALSTALPNAKLGVLFLPEGEFHELGLLYMHYLLKFNVIRVYYLGANVPVNDI
ncbi:MAG: MerR family transcriptional regulator, partial [Chitinophagaceae bacterium]